MPGVPPSRTMRWARWKQYAQPRFCSFSHHHSPVILSKSFAPFANEEPKNLLFAFAVAVVFLVVIPEGNLLLPLSSTYSNQKRPDVPSIAHYAMGGMETTRTAELLGNGLMVSRLPASLQWNYIGQTPSHAEAARCTALSLIRTFCVLVGCKLANVTFLN
jgi:hypothetical protein